MIRFLLGTREVAIADKAADTTVLSYLRNDCRRAGTKEGCASGDCGACTVVVASATDEGLEYEPLNACIAPLGALHGKQLITVEDLRAGEALHPVQAAMVDSHGSQCGFCTPGFIMSLFALYKRRAGGDASRHAILEALGGNLCRCTGYRPIVAAAERALANPDEDHFAQCAADTLATLRALNAQSARDALADDNGVYLRPESAQDVAQALAEHPQARLVAGATDLLLEVTQGLARLPVLIDLRAAGDLNTVTVDADGLHIGAAVTHAAAQTAVLAEYPELAELIERFGSLQIRSHGTVVGNIANASPIGDWPPVLLALGATLSLQGSAGIRTLPVDEFFLDYRKTALQPGEFIRSASIPRRRDGLLLRAYKISKRYEDDISSVCGVFALQRSAEHTETARVAFGGMAAVPARAQRCESALSGNTLSSAAVEAAIAGLSEDFSPISDARASAGYRRRVAGNLLRRLALEAQDLEPTRAYPVSYNGTQHG